MKLDYNAPVTATFALACLAAMALVTYSNGHITAASFAVPAAFDSAAALEYVRAFFHVLAHQEWAQLIANVVVILLIGPVIEEKYGSVAVLIMILMTAALSAMIHATFLSGSLVGASSVAFMLILVGSVPKMRQGRLPITVVLTVLLYLTPGFLIPATPESQFPLASILGGLSGSLLGFSFPARRGADAQTSAPTAVASQ